MSFEMSSEDFFLQLGPEFNEYAIIFNNNGFKDVATICTMEVHEDLLTMFPEGKMPLGHRRKIAAAVNNLKNATQPESSSSHDAIATINPSISKLKVCNEKKINELEGKLQKSMAKQRELNSYVPLPEPDGPLIQQTCSICHIRGHRSDGNKKRSSCDREPCISWKFCGRRDKHKNELSRIKRELEKETKELTSAIKELKEESEKMNSFAERSTSSFLYAMKPRLKAVDPSKYRNANLLMRDLLVLKDKYDNTIPKHHPSLDGIELPKALTLIADLKRKSSYNIEESVIESKKPCVPTTTCTITSPPAPTVSSAQQMIFPTYQQYYPYGYPMYYNPYAYSYNPGTFQPPLPTTPPPQNPPLPKGEPPK